MMQADMMPPLRDTPPTQTPPMPPRARMSSAALLSQTLGLLPGPEPIRPRTLIALRWAALAGQTSAALFAWALGAVFPVAAVALVIAATAVLNLALARWHRSRAGETETRNQLVFDMIHTGILLTLTGGTANPFALFVLVPLIIGATVLPPRPLWAIAVLTGVMILMMATLAVPLSFAPDAAVTPAMAMGASHLLALAIGGGFIATYAHRVAAELAATSNALAATQMGLAREQRLQHLGGVVAAAAHEMGTPLATIKLVASELGDELGDNPAVAEDLALLRSSVDRCRDILRSMGAAGKDDLLVHAAPLTDLLAEAAAPHADRGARIRIQPGKGGDPIVRRDAGVVHALRNLVQNAVDFARSEVAVETAQRDGVITVSIHDDGPGYPPALLDRLGEPFLSTRRADHHEAGYEGMGLGLFIARTLLERSGGSLRFFNQNGATALVSWPADALIADDRAVLGRNPAIVG